MDKNKKMICPKCGAKLNVTVGYDAIEEKNWYKYQCSNPDCSYESDYQDSLIKIA